ncbi:hypothetical protein ThvES_00017500 [Thiovulum sp. ES]|nr:hypothetical protein ThvES_00017500 [Thiovulum sp. ES]
MKKPLILSAITSSLLFGALKVERPVISSFSGELSSSSYTLNTSSGFIVGFESKSEEDNKSNFVNKNLGLYSNPEDYNIEPTITTSSSVSTNEDVARTISFSINDAEDDTIETTIIKNGSRGTLYGSGTSFRYAPKSNLYGSDSVTIEFDDGFGGVVTKNIDIYISSVDDAPSIGTLPTTTADEDSSAKTVSISISDVDSNVANASISVSNSNSAIVSTSVSGTTLTLTPIADKFGNATITVSAILDGKSTARSFSYTLNSVDDVPVLKQISAQTALEDSGAISIPIQLSDIDSEVSNANYSITNSNTEIATAEISGMNLIVTPIENMFGSSTISVSATLDGKTVSQSFSYNLTSVDDAPTLQSISNLSSSGESSTVALNLEDIDSDINSASFVVTSSNPAVATGKVENGQLIVTPTGEESGAVEFTVSATLDGSSVSQSFQYEVALPVESDIEISAIDDLDLEMSGETQSQNISFSVESLLPVSSIVVTSSSQNISVSSSDNSLSISIDGSFVGNSTITLTATDENGEKATETFNITVSANETQVCLYESSNELTFETIQGANERQDYIRTDLNLITALDVCGENIPVSWKSSNSGIVSSSGAITIDEEKDYTVQLVATIGEGEEATTKNFLVTIPKDELTDEIAVSQTIDILTFDSIKGSNLKRSEIYSSLVLSTEGVSDTEISWSSNNEAVGSDGSIYPTNEDIIFSLTATVSKGDVSDIKLFLLTLKGEKADDLEIINSDKEWLTISNILGGNVDSSNVKTALNLPEYGANGSEIEWSSSNGLVISDSGEVSRDVYIDKYIQITAYLSSGVETNEKVFSLKVPKLIEVSEIEKLEFDRVEDVEDNQTKTVSIFLKDEDNESVSTTVSVSKTLQEIAETTITDEAVKTTIESENGSATVLLSSDGTSATKVETVDENGNSFETKISIATTGSQTEVAEDGTIVSKIGNSEIKVAKTGEIETIVGKSVAQSKLAGGSVSVTNKGIETAFEEIVGGTVLKAKVSTDENAKTQTSFTVVDLTTGETTDLESTLSDGQSFDDNSTFEIDKDSSGELLIKIGTTLSNELEIK